MMGVGDTFSAGLLGKVSPLCSHPHIQLEVDPLSSWIPGRLWLRYSHSMKISQC